MEELSIGPKILQLRKKMKLTQVQLADKVGVSGAAISHFENGTSKPALETIEKLSQVLDFDFSTAQIKSKPIKLPCNGPNGELAWAFVDNNGKYSLITIPNPVALKASGVNRKYHDRIDDTVGLDIYSQAEFIKLILESGTDDTKSKWGRGASVLSLAGTDYQFAVVLEVQGSSMAPRYPEGSRYVLFPVSAEHWQYATGVHAIWLDSKKLLIKRIVSNKEGVITIKSDATGDQTTVELGDIAALWRFGQAIHLPPEEL